MVQVEVTEGVLEGARVNNEFGGEYYSFKGIPFAEPPIGDLRFKAPRPPKPWSGVRSALQHGPSCYQFDTVTQAPPSGSEDCLYLNVYSTNLKPTAPLPVMVFIHGGAFVSGNGNDDKYGPEFLVKENVILVTFNYRVEVLGFLCLDSEDVPGNAGMKDQVAALRWVKKNISKFGGDPENITIFGESAGGASVTFHLISPMSKGLFKRAIAQSGANTCFWSHPFEPRERAIALAKSYGFNSEDNKELYEFFKSLPVEKLVRINVPITFNEVAKDSANMQFGIVDEKKFGDSERFFYGNVFDQLKNINDGVEVIAGYCELEGLLVLGRGPNIEKSVALANKYREFWAPVPVTINCSLKDNFEVGRKMKKFYYNDEEVSMKNLEQLVRYYGISAFTFGIIQFHKICAQNNKNKTYLYKLTTKSERNLLGHVMGLGKIIGKSCVVTHADDLGYLFNMKMLNQKLDVNSKTYGMIDNMVKLWTNFAKYGNPTPDSSLGVIWSPYSLQEQDYLDIGETLVPGKRVDQKEIEFWEAIFKQYVPQFVA